MRPKKIILCVDDNEQELSVLKFMLATNGYRVVSACNAQEAIGIFAETPVDLVLADHGMPQMNGCQLVERLKQIASHVPMIVLGDPQRMAGEMHAADALLAKKNCSPQELLERIKVMSARKRGPRKNAAIRSMLSRKSARNRVSDNNMMELTTESGSTANIQAAPNAMRSSPKTVRPSLQTSITEKTERKTFATAAAGKPARLVTARKRG